MMFDNTLISREARRRQPQRSNRRNIQLPDRAGSIETWFTVVMI